MDGTKKLINNKSKIDKKELVRTAFSAALKHLFNEPGQISQTDCANKVGISLSSLNDYVGGRREGAEIVRREIAHTLGVDYDVLMTLGVLILEGFNPRDWVVTSESTRPQYLIWKSRQETSKNAIAVPFPGARVANVPLLEPVHKHVVNGSQKGYIGLPVFGPKVEGAFDINETPSTNRHHEEAAKLKELGGPKSCAFFVVADDGMLPRIPRNTMVLTQLVCDDLIEGEIYIVRPKNTCYVKARRIVPLPNNVIEVYCDNSTQYPAQRFSMSDIDILGQAKCAWINL